VASPTATPQPPPAKDGTPARPALALLAVLMLAIAVPALRAAWWSLPVVWRQGVEQRVFRRWLSPQHLGDGGPAAELLLCYPMGLAVNAAGELLIADRGRDRRGRLVWRIDARGVAHVVVGSGRIGAAREDSAGAMTFMKPESLAVAPDGSVYLSDGLNHAVFRVEPAGRVARIAGTGIAGFSGDGGPASAAQLARPADIRLDRLGNLFIADVWNQRVRRVDPAGRIATVAGTGERGFSPDGTPATAARLDTPWGIGLDLADRLLIADGGNHRVRRVEADGRLVTIAGNGRPGFDGDGGAATAASLNFPEALFVEPGGRLLIGDELNNALRVVDAAGVITTLMGTGFPGRAQVGAVARVSPLDDPEAVLGTADGVVISDGNNGRVIRVAADGIVRLVAGRSATAPCAPRW
jgi:sugar lactone lactonase YvrE